MNSHQMQPYQAPFLLNNAHIQNILSSTGLRKLKLRLNHPDYLKNHNELILQTPRGVRLMAKLNRHKRKAKSVVVLIHGWEGSSDSAYLLSMATKLFEAGYDTLRLHLRDHGNTTHLNKEIFNSSMVDEVVDAISVFQEAYQFEKYFLAGFSLGGNFVLRVGLQNHRLKQTLTKIMSVCPVLDPANAMKAMRNTFAFYDRYFVYKWKKSLSAKAKHFPEYNYAEDMKTMRCLDDMNQYFIPRFTPFKNLETYFESYTLSSQQLRSLDVPSLVIASHDDPIIPISDYQDIALNNNTQLETSAQGGHCAFLSSWTLKSWLDQRALTFFMD